MTRVGAPRCPGSEPGSGGLAPGQAHHVSHKLEIESIVRDYRDSWDHDIDPWSSPVKARRTMLIISFRVKGFSMVSTAPSIEAFPSRSSRLV
jgi:hypothetical protein